MMPDKDVSALDPDEICQCGHRRALHDPGRPTDNVSCWGVSSVTYDYCICSFFAEPIDR